MSEPNEFKDRNCLPPATDAVTLCELDGKLLACSSNSDPHFHSYARADGIAYPHIIVPYKFTDPARTNRYFTSATPRAQPANGLSGRLRLLIKALLEWKENGPFRSEFERWYSYAQQIIVGSKLRARQGISWATNNSYEERNYYQTLLNRLDEAPIKAFAWHNYRQVFAVAHRQDSVHIYDMVADHWIPQSPKGLINEYQKNVTCLAWRPNASGVLAVGCDAGVLLWRIFFAPPNTPATFPREGACVTSLTNPDQPGSAWATKLSFPGFGEVTTMAWSPDGLFLAVGSGTSPTILIWDVALEAATPIAMGRGGTLELKWSPDGNYLLQSNDRGMLRIWETQTWESTSLNCGRPVHSLCWLRGSKIFAFAIEGSHKIRVRQINREPPQLENKEVRVPSATLSSHEVKAMGLEQEKMVVGGPIKNIAVDPSGNRIVVSFQGDGRGSELLALLGVERTALPSFRPLGFIRGPKWHPHTPYPQPPRSPFKSEEASPADDNGIRTALANALWPTAGPMAFSPTFEKGALLSVCWENGKIGFVPFLFMK